MEAEVSGIDNLLDGPDLREKFPVAMAKVEKWFLNNEKFANVMMLKGADITDQKVLIPMIDLIIKFDPRKLYDIFDSYGCRIYIAEHPDGLETPGFVSYLNMSRESTVAFSRVEAEYKSFLKAFELLNND